MNTLSMTLTKKRKYTLKPFGRFLVKDNCGEASKKNPRTIDFGTLRFDSEKGMSYTKSQEDKFCKFMIKHKTDFLTDGRNIYTRIGDNWVEVNHSKLTSYKQFLSELQLEDNEESWNEYAGRMTR